MGSSLRKHPATPSGISEKLDRLANLLGDQAPERRAALFDEVLMPRKKQEPEPIGETLKAIIRERELTAYRLAQMTGSSIDSIQRWLNGEQGLTLKTVERLAAALDLVLVPREPEKGR
jgi:antitoxin component HigA of HigAB toxin-antitoxin module